MDTLKVWENTSTSERVLLELDTSTQPVNLDLKTIVKLTQLGF